MESNLILLTIEIRELLPFPLLGIATLLGIPHSTTMVRAAIAVPPVAIRGSNKKI